MATNPHVQIQNRLLALLRDDELDALHKYLEPIHFARKRVLYEAGQSMSKAYFFQSGIASLSAVGEDGHTVQIAIVGPDGFIGVPIITMGGRTPVRIVTQTAVEAATVSAEHLLAEFNKRRELRELLLRYSQVLQIQIMQTAVCKSLHTIKQQLCRWLLLYRDSTQTSNFDFTQEDFATMLGSHRNQISIAARDLGKRELIEYTRGQITLKDQRRLEKEACECYRIVRHWTDELISI